MIKQILTYGLTGSLLFYNCIFPTEPNSIDKNTTASTINESTQNPVSLEDLVLSLEISENYKQDSSINYTAKFQNQSGSEIKLDNSMEKINDVYVPNGYHKKAFEFKIKQGNQIVHSERNNSDMIIWLNKNGYIEQEAKGDTLITSICNAKVKYWKDFYDVPYPLKVKKTSITNSIKLQDGKYNFEIDVWYGKNDTTYHSVYASDNFQVGIDTGIKDYLYKKGKQEVKKLFLREVKRRLK